MDPHLRLSDPVVEALLDKILAGYGQVDEEAIGLEIMDDV
jgi:hypothetical protein